MSEIKVLYGKLPLLIKRCKWHVMEAKVRHFSLRIMFSFRYKSHTLFGAHRPLKSATFTSAVSSLGEPFSVDPWTQGFQVGLSSYTLYLKQNKEQLHTTIKPISHQIAQ